MAFRTSIAAALLTAFLMSGCMTTQKSSGLANPFAKGDFSALRKKRKKPLTQVAMDALRPKDKAPVKIVSPMDWFRGTSSTDEVASKAAAEQLTNLAAQYRAAAQQTATGAAQKFAQPIAASGIAASGIAAAGISGTSTMAGQPGVSPLLSFNPEGTAASATPSQVSMPSIPQNQLAQYQAAQSSIARQVTPQFPTIPHVANGLMANGAGTNVAANLARSNPSGAQTPKVQFQAARLPLGQPVANIQQTGAQYSIAAKKNVAQATAVAQAAMTQSVFPQVNTRVQFPSAPPQVATLPYATAAQASPSLIAPGVIAPNGSSASMGYPSTPQQALPSISTAVVQPRSPMYR